MEGGSASRGLEWNDSDANIRKSSRSIVSRMYVEGYDTWLSGYEFVMSMGDHFSSCGEVMHVYIPGYARRRPLNRFALIYLRGEGAEEKALKLSGSYSSRGHKLVVEPYPFHDKHHDHKFAPMRDADNKRQQTIFVGGFDTWGPSWECVEGRLFEQLSRCGRVLYVNASHVTRKASVGVEGIDTIENLLQLCGSDREGWKYIHMYKTPPPEREGERFPTMPPAWSFFPSSSSSTTSAMALAATAPEDPNLPKPPPEGHPLPYPWNCRVDSGTGNSCIWNAETGVQLEIPPSFIPAPIVRYAPEDPNLPKPWKALVDRSTGYGYFWNTETNVTQYESPQPTFTCSSPASPGETDHHISEFLFRWYSARETTH
uniref:DEAD-box ATP-dependent RNA helicase 46 n=1 Tax=Noccaea caerulescens TaxID=107243 RepID=A0A1J3HKB9_NOCCA